MIAPLLAWRPAGGLSYQRKEYTYGRKDFIGCQHRRLSDSHYLLSSDKVPDYHGQVLRQAGCPDTGNPQGTLVSSHINCHFANYKSSSYAGWQSFLWLYTPKNTPKYTHKILPFWVKISNSPLWHHIGSKIGMALFRDVAFCAHCNPIATFWGKTEHKKTAPDFSEASVFKWCRRPDSNRHVFAYGRF